MKAAIYHFQINVSNPQISIPYYSDLFSYLDFKVIDKGEDYLGVSDGKTDIWVVPTTKNLKDKNYNRDATGLNHFALKLESKENVEKFMKEFIVPRNIQPLFETPKNRPEFRESGIYYQVIFEDPDKILIEVLYNE